MRRNSHGQVGTPRRPSSSTSTLNGMVVDRCPFNVSSALQLLKEVGMISTSFRVVKAYYLGSHLEEGGKSMGFNLINLEPVT
ncbi:hypothetical protein VM1G_11853 [Cytospora mali]|uniref:Uncharacterized protein n=1 Tax=Cytospora mali TaxID=578113 RepID=A0A194W9I7_CYTMA|nr:hypothetical protein VM1G_11853 [Valsa mali]